ncbi:MAG: GDSL-type esterase/lipase family protein [Pedobacter sp.]
MKRILIILSISLNIVLLSVFAYKIYNNWFEGGVLKLPFRTTVFSGAPKQEGLIYFLGDSHTEAFELNEYLNNCAVRNRGVWGDNSAGVLSRIDSVTILKPSKVFLMIGVNDILSGLSVDETFANMIKIIQRIRRTSPSTAIYLQSVFPTNNKILHSDSTGATAVVRLNNMYKSLDDNSKVTFINLYPAFAENGGLKKELNFDDLHLSGKGYFLWASLIKEYL